MLKINKKIFYVVFVFLLFTVVSFVIIATRNNPSEPVRKVTIDSDNYDNPGSYHIEKSAKWLDTDKAEITFDLNTIPITDGRYKDVVFVIDMSGSMVGDRLNIAKSNSKELVNLLLEDEHNRISLISFDTTSEILSSFTDDKELIINEIDELSYRGATNYNAALKNVIEVLDGYQEKENTDLIILFLTDGHPNEDTPNQIGTYQILKNMYPYSIVHGVQYEMGADVVSEIVNISDYQWIADINSLHNVLIDAVLSPLKYDEYKIIDYIDKDYFNINSSNDIEVSVGSATIEEENGYQKIIWNLGNSFSTGNNANMKIKVKLKDEYVSVEGLYSTNDHEQIISKIVDREQNNNESDKTPVLKNYYSVIYDTNTPEGCTLENIESENHFVFTNVNKKQEKLSCSGYLFKEWKIVDDDVVRVNDDTFIMPDHDVNIKAIWGKVDISKSMNGKIYEKTTLYKAVENEAINGTEAYLYTGETDDGGGEENVYIYDGINHDNVLFGNFCFKIFRTTDTGGVKIVYNGRSDDAGKCGWDREVYNDFYSVGSGSNLSGTSYIAIPNSYKYGTSYTYDNQTGTFTLSGDISEITDNNYNQIIGQYTCKNSETTCNKLYYVIQKYNSSYRGIEIIGDSKRRYAIGESPFNSTNDILGYAGYMYNIIYKRNDKQFTFRQNILSSRSLNTEFFYSDSYTIDDNGYYRLNSPMRIESTANYSNMKNMYTFFNNTSEDYSSQNINYITNVEDSEAYYLKLSYGYNLNSYDYEMLFSDEINDNHDGTYSLSGNILRVKPSQWYENYQSIINKYTCLNKSTCSDPYYITSTNKEDYEYVNVKNDYKYGKSFKYDYDSGTYELKDTINFYDYQTNYSKLNNYHYTCFNTTGVCQNISYIYYVYSKNRPYYISLSNNKGVNDAIDEMLFNENVNSIDSDIKIIIDDWYKNYLLQYQDNIEDIVYCNDRGIRELGGWNEQDGDIKGTLYFNKNNSSIDLTCSNIRDRFTVSSNYGNDALTYPIGLLTKDEASLVRKFKETNANFHLLTPSLYERSIDSFYLESRLFNDIVSYVNSALTKYIRPVISLKPGIEYTAGDGSEDKPYYVPTD